MVGTLERIPGRSDTYGFTRSARGTLTPEYTGYTEIFWNDQITVEVRDRQTIVVDSDGNTWPTGACTIVEDDRIDR